VALRPPAVVERPDGLVYRDGFVTEDEEQACVAVLEALAFDEVRMRGQAAKRTVAHFGYRYGYESWAITPAEPSPPELDWLRERAGALAEVDPDLFVETLVTRYPPGAGIGWHRDAPAFGSKVVGVSFLSGCTMRFQRRTETVRHTFALELAPRSAYVLAGAARWTWQHSIAATPALRYSVTFRTLAEPRRSGGGPPRRPPPPAGLA
jgi:alkylated DNA repair protein (DNA oxidative demethylase)